jgi:type II secretory pathway pseudopilin PulG
MTRRPTSIPRSDRAGLTLIEITIGLAIAALVMGMSVVAINSLTDAALRSSAVELTGAIKYSFDRAIMQNRVQRLAMDLDEGTWWLEYTPDPFSISQKREEGETGAKKDEDGKIIRADDDDLALDLGIDRDTDVEVRKALEGGRAAGFLPEEEGEPRKLPRGVRFSRVWTGHQEDAFKEGIAFLHFFKSGWSEPAFIELKDGEDDVVVLQVAPLTGRVETTHEPFEVPELDDYDGFEEGDL